MLINMFFSSKPDDLVDFSKFRGLIESGRITRIVIADPYYVGYGPESQAAVSAEGQKWSPFGFSSSDEDSGRPVYRTNGKWSEDFEKLLIEKGVEYKFESRQSGIFIQILFNLLVYGGALICGISFVSPFWIKLYDLLVDGPVKGSRLAKWLQAPAAKQV